MTPFLCTLITWWTFRIFFYFFCSGRGKGESEESGGGLGSIFIENPRRGGGVLQEGEGLRAREGVCSELGNGGGAKYFLRGRNVHQDKVSEIDFKKLLRPHWQRLKKSRPPSGIEHVKREPNPKGPKIEKFKILKFSSEIENFKRATRQTPIFCGEY